MEPSNLLIIKTLTEGWSDKDNVMLHACFQLLTDCIEQERLFDSTTDWNQDEKFKHAKEEIGFLYAWWQKRVKMEQENKLDPIWSDNQYEEDNQMLIRLIKSRQYLWT